MSDDSRAGSVRGATSIRSPRALASASLYDKLEHTVVPLFATRDGWIKIMKSAISRDASLFHSHRIMRRYAANAYFG